MKESQIRAFLGTAIFNPAAGNEKISFAKMSIAVSAIYAVLGIAFTFPLRIPDNESSLRVKVVMLLSMLIIIGVFTFLSTKFAKDAEYRNIFRSIIFFDCQLVCMAFLAPMINFTFYESTTKLLAGIIESGIVICIFVVTTIVRVRYKIRNGGYINNSYVKPPKYPVVVSMLTYIIMVELGRESIGMMMHIAILVFCMPVVVLTFNVMQLYYARKYDLYEMIENEAYVKLAQSVRI